VKDNRPAPIGSSASRFWQKVSLSLAVLRARVSAWLSLAERAQRGRWALAERLDRPRTTVHKTLTGQRRLDPIEFLDW